MQYRVYNGSTLLTTTTNTLTYTASGLKPLTAYTFGVSAWNGARESAQKTLAVTTRGIQLVIPTTIAVGTAVTLRRQDYSLGLVPIGTEPAGDFGGVSAGTLAAKVVASSGGSSTIELTVADETFADQTKLALQPDGTYAAFDGYKAIYYG
jgi:hypothetical protein